jgi:hypothetical protein
MSPRTRCRRRAVLACFALLVSGCSAGRADSAPSATASPSPAPVVKVVDVDVVRLGFSSATQAPTSQEASRLFAIDTWFARTETGAVRLLVHEAGIASATSPSREDRRKLGRPISRDDKLAILLRVTSREIERRRIRRADQPHDRPLVVLMGGLPIPDGDASGFFSAERGYPLIVLEHPRADRRTANDLRHELGHHFGLGHANRLDCTQDGSPRTFRVRPRVVSAKDARTCSGLEYGDLHSLMGGGKRHDPDPWSAAELWLLGSRLDLPLLPETRRQRLVHAGTRELTLASVLGDGPGPRLLEIPAHDDMQVPVMTDAIGDWSYLVELSTSEDPAKSGPNLSLQVFIQPRAESDLLAVERLSYVLNADYYYGDDDRRTSEFALTPDQCLGDLLVDRRLGLTISCVSITPGISAGTGVAVLRVKRTEPYRERPAPPPPASIVPLPHSG